MHPLVEALRGRMPPCSKCRQPNPRGASQRYCVKCHNANMKIWRKDHPLSPEQTVKANARAYAKVYHRRGKLIQQPCQTCGSSASQMHHEDYSKPLDVIWLCRPCHLTLHNG